MKNVNKVAGYFMTGKIAEKLDDAKMLMDEAVKDPKSAEKEKTWFYRAQVYAEILKATEPAVRQMAPDAVDVILESFDKIEALEGGPNGKMGQQTILIREGIRVALFNRGVEEQKEPEKAYQTFKDVARIAPDDTLAIKYAGYFAAQADKNEEALALYQKLLEDTAYNQVDVYHYITQIRSMELQKMQNQVNQLKDREAPESEIKATEAKMTAYKDATHALVREGSEKFPDDIYLLGRSIDFYIYDGKSKEAIQMLHKATKLAPDNAVLYTNLGLLYYRDFQDEPKAIENYKKSIEIDPNDFNSQMGMAIIHYNRGAKIMSDLKIEVYENKKSPEMVSVLKHFKEALPYMEKAHEISPNEIQPLAPLKSIYRELGMRDKEKAMDAKIKSSME
ncbi:MAG: tetratricopeptide repeat protein [Bernardetiaceae bacterium]